MCVTIIAGKQPGWWEECRLESQKVRDANPGSATVFVT